jgi:pimeloyl-ACP methyl ester carboxylesterase
MLKRGAIGLAVAALLGLPGSAAAAPTLKVGSLRLHRCAGAWCGSLARPLDPAQPSGRRIAIGFKWFPARVHATGPTLVAVEGGPGYPSTGSEVEYQGIYGPLLDDRDLLLVDNRGTGSSALIDCRELQRFIGRTSGSAFAVLVGRCARQIDQRFGAHASDLFATAYAVADLAAVLRALDLDPVDLYGDSYGTWFTQAFMARDPQLLHSVVLDSAYPARDLDPWYASSGEAARQALDAVCARDPGCAAGSATARLAELASALRTAPLTGITRDSDSTPVPARVGVRTLVDLVQDSGSDPVVLRELDASVRAALTGDSAPLLRLAAQSDSYDHGTSTADYFSDGLYWGVSCLDYPQLFSLDATPAARRQQLAAALGAAPSAFAPFTAAEWVQMSGYSQPYDGCLNWPRPLHQAPALPPDPAPLPASVPLLMLGGDLDSLTPLADAQVFGPKLGATVRVVALRNSVHVTSEGDTFLVDAADCGRRIIRAFVSAPQQLASLDASCADATPPLHTAGAYPQTLADATPATLVSGPDPGLTARRAATIAAGALADATIRRYYSGGKVGPGLRGGRFTATGDQLVRLRLIGVAFTEDTLVSGPATWRPATGEVNGTLTVAGVKVGLHWTQASAAATATVGGAVLTLPAP